MWGLILEHGSIRKCVCVTVWVLRRLKAQGSNTSQHDLAFLISCVVGTDDIQLKHIHKTFRTPVLSMTKTDQVNPGESYGPLMMSPVKSTSISVDEGEETG